jgi:septum formation protein
MIDLPYRLVLGSASPRRKSLLEAMDFIFEVRVTEVNEDYPTNMVADEVAEFLACKKAAAAVFHTEDELIICADTVVVLEKQLLGKPHDAQEAFQLLKKQSGRQQTVFTGVCLRTSHEIRSFTVATSVYFNHLTEEEIWYYINKYRPFDKAGAYGIQEWLGNVGIARIEGSYTNVMGLPTEALYTALRGFAL